MTKKGSLTFVFSIILFIGGIIGYVKAGSVASITVASTFAFLLLLSAIGLYKKSVLAFFSSVALTGLLSFFFLWRFMLTQTFMPSGLMAVLSVLVFLALISLPDEQKRV